MNEEQHLPYWKIVNKKGKVVIVSQTGSILLFIHNQRGLYFNHVKLKRSYKRILQVLNKLHTKKIQIAFDTLSVLEFPLVEIETYFPSRFLLCTYIEMFSIQNKEDMTKVQVKKYFSLNLVVNLMLIYLLLQSLCGKT